MVVGIQWLLLSKKTLKNAVYFTNIVIKFPNDFYLFVSQIIIKSQVTGKCQILNDYVICTNLAVQGILKYHAYIKNPDISTEVK